MNDHDHVGRSAYTPKELAERWGVHVQTVRRSLHAGKLRGFKVGAHSWRVPLSVVEEFEATQGIRNRWFSPAPGDAAEEAS